MAGCFTTKVRTWLQHVIFRKCINLFKESKVQHRASLLSYKFFLLNTIAIILYYKHLNNNPFTAVLILSSFPPSSWSEAIVAGVVKATGSSVDNEREPQTQRTAPGGFWEPKSEWGDLTNTGTTRHGTGHRHRRHTCKRAIYRAGLTPRRQIKLFFYTCSSLHLSLNVLRFDCCTLGVLHRNLFTRSSCQTKSSHL